MYLPAYLLLCLGWQHWLICSNNLLYIRTRKTKLLRHCGIESGRRRASERTSERATSVLSLLPAHACPCIILTSSSMTAVPYHLPPTTYHPPPTTYPGTPYPTLQSFHPLPFNSHTLVHDQLEAQAYCCSALDRLFRFSRLTIPLQDHLRGRRPKPLHPQIDIDQETTSRPIHPHNRLSAQPSIAQSTAGFCLQE